MKVTITGANYEGASFRGIDSEIDDTFVQLQITGSDEVQIANYISWNFSYGNEYDSLSELIADYNSDNIPNGDGCGVVTSINVNDELVFEDENFSEEYDEPPLPLAINLDTDQTELNELISLAVSSSVAE